MKNLMIALCCLGLYSVVLAGTDDSYDKTTDYKKLGWMDKGMDAARQKLKDSSSAQFRGVYFGDYIQWSQ